jgi:hypothetical protein
MLSPGQVQPGTPVVYTPDDNRPPRRGTFRRWSKTLDGVALVRLDDGTVAAFDAQGLSVVGE